MSDLISRQDVLQIVFRTPFFSNSLTDEIRALPSAEPNCSETPNSWIPVSERLPEDFEYVLVSGTGIVKQAQFIKGLFEADDLGCYATLDGCGVFGSDYTFKATAWMPLPKPYQTKEDIDA